MFYFHKFKKREYNFLFFKVNDLIISINQFKHNYLINISLSLKNLTKRKKFKIFIIFLNIDYVYFFV